jgi:hypothetical protein
MIWLNRLANWLLLSPVLWGALSSTAFHLFLGTYHTRIAPWLLRCLTGQGESYVCTTLFFIAIAFVGKRCVYVAIQALALQRFAFDGANNTDLTKVGPEKQLESFEKHAWAKRSTLYRRLRDAWQLCNRQANRRLRPQQLEELANTDYDRIRVNYGLLRLLVWAIPSCASVSTILAIAESLEKIAPGNSSEVLTEGTQGLAAAFTVFALFVGLAILLVACRFILEQAEEHMLAGVDRQVSLALFEYLDDKADGSDAQVTHLQEVTESLKAIAGSLSQQAVVRRRAASDNIGAGQVSSPGLGPQDIEVAVQKAMAAALQGQPLAGVASTASTTIDGAGWKSLQQVLQKLAVVLEQQNAKLDAERLVSKQLSAILGEGLNDTQHSLRVRQGSEQGDDLVMMLDR